MAIASLILASSVFVYSLKTANAEIGPSASLGSNPIFSAYSSACSSAETVANVPADSVLIITDVFSAYFNDEDLTLKTGAGQTLAKFHQERFMNDTYNSSYWSQTNAIVGNVNSISSGIVVPAGEELVVECSGNMVTVSGYYAHP